MFPDFIKKLNPNNYGVEGLEVYFDHTPNGTVYFFSTKNEFALPEHSHASQWGIVISGEYTLNMNGESKIFKAGETYVIPPGVKHQSTYHAGFSEIGYVDDPNYS